MKKEEQLLYAETRRLYLAYTKHPYIIDAMEFDTDRATAQNTVCVEKKFGFVRRKEIKDVVFVNNRPFTVSGAEEYDDKGQLLFLNSAESPCDVRFDSTEVFGKRLWVGGFFDKEVYQTAMNICKLNPFERKRIQEGFSEIMVQQPVAGALYLLTIREVYDDTVYLCYGTGHENVVSIIKPIKVPNIAFSKRLKTEYGGLAVGQDVDVTSILINGYNYTLENADFHEKGTIINKELLENG